MIIRGDNVCEINRYGVFYSLGIGLVVVFFSILGLFEFCLSGCVWFSVWYRGGI